jgi:hypothetical protein
MLLRNKHGFLETYFSALCSNQPSDYAWRSVMDN